MSIKDYTNEEVLRECLISFCTLCSEVGIQGMAKQDTLEKYKLFRAEVLDRMSTSNGNNK